MTRYERLKQPDYRILAEFRQNLRRYLRFSEGAAREAGVAHVLALIEAEMRVAMALTGVTRIDQLDCRAVQLSR